MHYTNPLMITIDDNDIEVVLIIIIIMIIGGALFLEENTWIPEAQLPNGTESFYVKPITPGHPLPKISTRLTIFWGGTWKTEFVKSIHRQKRTSSEEKSDAFHNKCSIELWTILMFELVLCCHTAARCVERT